MDLPDPGVNLTSLFTDYASFFGPWLGSLVLLSLFIETLVWLFQRQTDSLMG